MKSLLFLLALQVPFLLFMWLVPPEQRAPSRKVGAWLLAGLSLLAAIAGVYFRAHGDGFAVACFVFAICAALAAAARAKGWIGPPDRERHDGSGG
ncbi:hypothetical protein E2493_19620 [Sphingomonas parva]|uniref:DUF2484 family protein n=1 Tax=Sphingomonas parva TaxID=2555898 RepID=A0A4Y8ZP05_9SPHN|nr:hypothetical protein [Sphingomonas parva]TFI56549.1 hypothetical protein E2493_19620 [Sphingomonas parva]